jgi:hypothetical protein
LAAAAEQATAAATRACLFAVERLVRSLGLVERFLSLRNCGDGARDHSKESDMKSSPGETSRPVESQTASEERSESLGALLCDWLRNQSPWWSMSFTVHFAALASLLLLGRFAMPSAPKDDVASFVAPLPDPHVDEISSVATPSDPNSAKPNNVDVENPLPLVASSDVDRLSPMTGPQSDPKANPEPTPGAQDLSVAPSGFPPLGSGPGPRPRPGPIGHLGSQSDATRPY